MRKYTNQLQSGGVPIKADDQATFQTDIVDTLMATIKGLVSGRANHAISSNDYILSPALNGFYNNQGNLDGVVLNGCHSEFNNFQFIDNNDTGTFSVTSGLVYIGDELCRYDGDDNLSAIATTKHPFLYKDTPINTSRVHQDGATKVVVSETKVIYGEFTIASPPGGGSYIRLDSDGAYLDSQKQAMIAKVSEDLYATNQELGAVGGLINTANTKSTITVSIDTPADWSILSNHNIKLTKFHNSVVYMEAAITHITATFSNVCTIPVGWRPGDYSGPNFSLSSFSSDPDPNQWDFHINSSGVMTARWDNSYTGWIKTFWFL